MSADLRNVTTGDAYLDRTTVHYPDTKRLTLQVANAAVLYQLDKSVSGDGDWTEERFLLPTVGQMSRECSGFRCRSASVGAPAQVTVEMLSRGDLADEVGDTLSPLAERIDSAGKVIVPGELLAYVEQGGAIAGTILTTGALAMTANQVVEIDVYVPHSSAGAGGTIEGEVWDELAGPAARVTNGRLWSFVVSGAVGGGLAMGPQNGRVRFTAPATRNYQFSVHLTAGGYDATPPRAPASMRIQTVS